MKKRSLLALSLSMTLLVTMVAGCGGTTTGADASGAGASSAATASANGSDASKEASPDSSGPARDMTILYPGDMSNRMSELLDNEIGDAVKTDLNVSLIMVYSPWDQYWEKKSIMLAAQEPVDLYWDGNPNLNVMVSKKECQPLDDLIAQYGQDMLKVFPADYLKGGMIDGKVMGIPSASAPSSAMFQFVCLRQDLLEAVGMTDVKTAEDLMQFSKLAKEKFPDIKGGGEPLMMPLTRCFGDEQYNFVTASDLVVFGEESGKAISYYESEAFKKLMKFSREMSLAGQYSDELTIKYNERDSRVQSGVYLWVEGSLGKDLEIQDAVKANALDARMANYLLAPEKPRYVTSAGGEVLCVPYSATNAVDAIRFVNWLYASADHYNLALYGVEGKDWKKTENGRLERLITDELFYEWMFRNPNYQMFAANVSDDYIEIYRNWDKEAKVSKSFGFRFDNTPVKDLEAQLIEAVKGFTPLLTGFVDPDAEYPKAVQALKDAGIDQYVAEVQRQLDAYIK